MNQQTLPIPNPGDWMTRSAVAREANVNTATVMRWAAEGLLKMHKPIAAPGEIRQVVIFWRPEVEALIAARRLAGSARG